MATLYLPSSGGYSTGTYVRYRIEVVEGAISGRTRSITVYVKYWRTNTGYSTYGTGTCYCSINGTAYSSSVTSSQVVTYNSYTTFFSKTVTVSYDNYGNASIPITAYSSTSIANLNSSANGGTLKLSNIGAVKYTVSYKANSGSGAPASQTKSYGTALTLSSTKPTRTGYTFKNWNTASGGSGTSYAPGASYTANAAVTLYAQWTANTYTVSYNANGGSGAPSSQTKTYGTALSLSTTKPTRTNYTFKGWGTSASSTTVSYAAGASYTTNAAITLYAVWELAYTKPTITSVVVERCDSEGTISDEGTYFKVSFNWTTDSNYAVSSIKIAWSSTSSTVSASGTSGSVSQILGDGALSTESSYSVTITVADSNDSTSVTKTISAYAYAIDVLAGGTGVAIGKPAETASRFEVAWSAYFRNTIIDRYGYQIMNGMSAYTTSGYDPDTALSHQTLTNHANGPDGGAHYWYIKTEFYSTKSVTANRIQTAFPYDSTTLPPYYRFYYNGSWSSWVEFCANRLACVTMTRSSEGDTMYIATRTDTDVTVRFGVGASGINRGVYDTTLGMWMIYCDGTAVRLPRNPTAAACFRFTDSWIGIYASNDNAASNTSRKCYIGYQNSTDTTWRVVNEFGTNIYLLNSDGAGVTLWGSTLTWTPMTNGGCQLGTASYRWGQIYSSSSSISTSDRNLKKDFTDFDERYENLFFDLKPMLFKFIDGTSDRFHSGFIAQDVEESFEKYDLNALDFAGFCKDKAQYHTDEEEGRVMHDKLDEDGNPIYEYSLRYEEFIALNTHMLQKAYEKIDEQESTIQEQQKQIDSLEERIAKLEKLLTNQ